MSLINPKQFQNNVVLFRRAPDSLNPIYVSFKQSQTIYPYLDEFRIVPDSSHFIWMSPNQSQTNVVSPK